MFRALELVFLDTPTPASLLPSSLPARLAAIVTLGHMYETLGRMTGRSYEETVGLLVKGLKNAESQTRMETMRALGKVCTGLGSAASNVHRDIFKAVKGALADRNMPVRAAAAYALGCMAESAQFLLTTELESVATLCFRAFDGANYETRKAIARCLGGMLAATQKKHAAGRAGEGRKEGRKDHDKNWAGMKR